MYVFNRITVNPQLPKEISKLSEIANILCYSERQIERLYVKGIKHLF